MAGRKHPARWGFWSLLAQVRLRLAGAKVGRGLRALGPILLRIEPGWNGQITIDENVTLLPYVDFRLRERGSIFLGAGVYLETMTRLVAANQAVLKIGAESQVGMGSIINAGDNIHIGEYVAIAVYCSLVASEHAYLDPTRAIKHQGYNHAPITIGDNVWLATGVLVRPGVAIGAGAIVGAQAVVHTDVPPNTLVLGNPAKPVKQRL